LRGRLSFSVHIRDVCLSHVSLLFFISQSDCLV
jgi:hypothetical protein